MDMNNVIELMHQFDRTSLEMIDVELSGMKVRIERGQTVAGSQTDSVKPAEMVRQNVEIQIKDETEVGDIEVAAPLVGTFYSAPSPEDSPYVEIGQTVKKGEVIGIIEAMKLMNEIVAPEDGVITSIEVENEELVEFGQVLIRMKEL